jgi:hypothetical protein
METQFKHPQDRAANLGWKQVENAIIQPVSLAR